MRRLISITFAVFVFCLGGILAKAQPARLAGNWAGGFWFKTHWVQVLLRFEVKQNNAAGTANVVFSSYEGTNGAGLTALEFDKAQLGFEIPLPAGPLAFQGQLRNSTIAGTYQYAGSSGTMGLTRAASVDSKSLSKLFGLYRFADRIVAIGADTDATGALRYIDFSTRQSAALWPISEDSFFGGDGRRRVNYPVRLSVHAVRGRTGASTKLIWKFTGARTRTGTPIPLTEKQLTWHNGDVTLGGTLITPPTPGPHPVIIIVPGDYGSGRNSLRLYAYNFLRRGIGVLIFDARGAGASTGPANSSSFSDLANDVLAGIKALQSMPNVNPKQVGLFGFSNSAFTTSLAASRSRDVAFLINQSMSSVPGWQQETYRVGAMLQTEGFSQEEVRQGLEFMKLKFEVARTGEGWERLQSIRARSGNERWFPFTNPGSSLARLRAQWAGSLTYDPGLVFDKIACPVLAVFGEKDVYIPAKESAAILERAMKRGGNKDYTIKLLPRASHSMFDGETGGSSESSESKGFADDFLNLTADWLAKRVDVRK